MKNFIVGFSKVIPWINLICGIIYVFTNTPKNKYGDENAVIAILMLIGVVLSSILLLAFSYVVEASVKYLKNR